MSDDAPEPGESGALLELRLIKEIRGQFFVPAYQRGYRWGKHEVESLLDDVWARAEHPDGTPYSLQPIVVKRAGGRWELVDGQQRLTTLYLIFRYMQSERLMSTGPRYSLSYDTRPGSEEYLLSLDPERSKENIDFFHLHAAHETIGAWFARSEDRQLVAVKLYPFLLEQVRVLWYVAPAGVDSTTLFTRLNVGRIQLTDAELVKALLLTRFTQGEGGLHWAKEVAGQWDAIERDLRDPEVWAFVGDADGLDRPTRITLLLDSLAGAPRERPSQEHQTFDALQRRLGGPSEAKVLWDEVLDLHAVLRGWFEDPDIYNLVGYLVESGVPFADLVQLARKRSKSDLKAALAGLIRERLGLTWSGVETLVYDSNADRCVEVLLLANVETARGRQERFSFRQYRKGHWSLEHIHAQQAESLTKEKEWREWLVSHGESLAGLPADGREPRRDKLIARIEAAKEKPEGRVFAELSRDVMEYFTLEADGGPPSRHSMHALSNLALLDGATNSALKNSVFEVKRQRLLEKDREGTFIPVCTRRVFLKYYTQTKAQQVYFWSPQDRDGYLDAVRRLLGPYLQDEAHQP